MGRAADLETRDRGAVMPEISDEPVLGPRTGTILAQTTAENAVEYPERDLNPHALSDNGF